MRSMTKAEYTHFLMTGTRTAKVATVRANGAPHVTPIWFVLDGDDLLFTTNESYLKTQHLRRDARVCLCVDDETAPFAFVMVEGTVTLSDTLTEGVHWATRIGGRYMGADRAEDLANATACRENYLSG